MKKLISILIICLFIFTLASCDADDLTTPVVSDRVSLYEHYNYCYIKLPDGTVIEGTPQDYNIDYDNTLVRVVVNNKLYLIGTNNITLIYDPTLDV